MAQSDQVRAISVDVFTVCRRVRHQPTSFRSKIRLIPKGELSGADQLFAGCARNPRSFLGFSRQSLQLAGQGYFGRRRHSIDKQNSIQMIGLMLDGTAQQACRFKFDPIPLQILRRDFDPCRSAESPR